MTEQAPRRPRTLEPSELGFTMKGPVQWLSPKVLVQTGLHVVLSGIFGAYADKRELQGVMSECEPTDLSGEGELWIDYVSDLGDGFDATYTVARALAAPTLDLGGPTRRGRVLVMGGDQVYPSATTADYENRLTGPYRAALPYTEEPHPQLYALPGNHDWYDGLTAFLRVFCQGAWVGGWKTQQTRSYWAVKLPARWWLLGIDIQFDTYVDKEQLEFFAKVPLAAGDSVVLCSAKPSWVEANVDKPEAYQVLDFFERKVVVPKGAQVRLSLTGDTHHYARYTRADGRAHKVTAGGGGAYLSATHHLPEELCLPPPTSRDPNKSPPAVYRIAACYPERATSRRFRWKAARLAWLNPGFPGLGAGTYLLFAFVLASARRGTGDPFGAPLRGLTWWDAVEAIPRSGVALLLAVASVAGLAGFTKAKGKPLVRWPVGIAHAAVHLALVAAVCAVASSVADDLGGAAFLIAFAVVVALGGAVGTSVVMALYLAVADVFRLNANELFAGQRFEGCKCFVRMHLAPTGVLTVHAAGIDRVGRGWGLAEEAVGAEPWLEAARPPSRVRLIDGPIVIDPREGA